MPLLLLQVDLLKLFPQHKWLFPTRAYLASTAGSATAWRTLFKSLGFTDFIQAPLVTLRLTPQQKAASHWAGTDLGPLSAGGYYSLQDWSADEFKAVVGSLQQHCRDKAALQTHCGQLAHCIDTLWEDEFAGCVSAQLGAQVTGEYFSYRYTVICLRPTPPLPSPLAHAPTHLRVAALLLTAEEDLSGWLAELGRITHVALHHTLVQLSAVFPSNP